MFTTAFFPDLTRVVNSTPLLPKLSSVINSLSTQLDTPLLPYKCQQLSTRCQLVLNHPPFLLFRDILRGNTTRPRVLLNLLTPLSHFPCLFCLFRFSPSLSECLSCLSLTLLRVTTAAFPTGYPSLRHRFFLSHLPNSTFVSRFSLAIGRSLFLFLFVFVPITYSALSPFLSSIYYPATLLDSSAAVTQANMIVVGLSVRIRVSGPNDEIDRNKIKKINCTLYYHTGRSSPLDHPMHPTHNLPYTNRHAPTAVAKARDSARTPASTVLFWRIATSHLLSFCRLLLLFSCLSLSLPQFLDFVLQSLILFGSSYIPRTRFQHALFSLPSVTCLSRYSTRPSYLPSLPDHACHPVLCTRRCQKRQPAYRMSSSSQSNRVTTPTRHS